MDHTNLFNPFSSLPPEHENRLTWAFLMTLKYDPLLQSFLRELVESKLSPKVREHGNFWEPWEPARVSTQTKWIDSSTNHLVSVLLTDEAIQGLQVEWSDRGAIYDGVIEFPDGLTLIVENKPSRDNVDAKQLSPSRSSFPGNIDQCTLHGSAMCLEWSEVLEGVLRHANSKIASFSSREICLDLLSFVEEFHPDLTPYRTFRLCGDKPEALRRRTIRLLDALARRVGLERRDDYLFRPGKIAERVAIWVEAEKRTLILGLWPADTVRQARRFYQNVDRTALVDLNKWQVEPNLHFSFMNKHLIWTDTDWPTDRYFGHFADGKLYGQMNQTRLVPLIQQWEKIGLITGKNRGDIEYQFKSTRR
ncbi:MAG: hypothetical protein F4X19_03360, partial [Acidobacteria bacterium]|nr:hypothetical protein [Acidobacteriota bacterium]